MRSLISAAFLIGTVFALETNAQAYLTRIPDSVMQTLKVGVIRGEHFSSFSSTPYFITKFINVGFRQVDSIYPGIDTSLLRTYDIFYFPLGWCYDQTVDAWVSDNAGFFKSFVYNGGYIVLEQPNCGKPLVMLPYPVYLSTWYDRGDYPEIILDSAHYITKGIDADDIPMAADQIDSIDSHYASLVKGRATDVPDFNYASYGQGRVFLYLGNTARDTLLYRIMTWNAWARLYSRRVSFTLVSSSTNLVSDVYLRSPFNTILFRNNFSSIGKTVDTTYVLGNDFVLSINVYTRMGNFEYFSNSECAQIIQVSKTIWEFRFEDSPEPGKHWDYNDVVIRMTLADDDTLTTAVNARPIGGSHVFSLQQNIPNPFNPSTTIEYRICDADNVQVDVCDVKGKMVDILVHEFKKPGVYTVTWNASRHASGVYFFRLQSGKFFDEKKGILLK